MNLHVVTRRNSHGFDVTQQALLYYGKVTLVWLEVCLY